MKIKLIILNLVCISALVIPFISAADNGSQINWIMTGNSPLLDRSTAYLARGNTSLGIRYAYKALERSQSSMKDLIGNHNLCIALTLEGKVEAAASHCRKAESMEIPDLSLRRIKDGLYKVRRGNTVSGTDTSIGLLITGNLRNLTGNQVSQLDTRL